MSRVVKRLMNNFVCVLSSDYSVYYILLHVLHCIFRSSPPDGLLVKDVPKICSKFILLRNCDFNLQSNFIEITLRHGRSPVNLLHIFKTPLLTNTSSWLLLDIYLTWKNNLKSCHFCHHKSCHYIDYTSNSFTPMLPNFLVNKKNSNKGLSLNA